jgi:hypothetical protein
LFPPTMTNEIFFVLLQHDTDVLVCYDQNGVHNSMTSRYSQ